MRWPWKRQSSNQQLVVSWSQQTLAYVLSRLRVDGAHEVIKFGVERQGADSMEDFTRRLQSLGLKGFEARFMLRPEQYQLLQIDAPAVAPEELRSAARYQIREMLDTHVDDVTLDVMRVGGVDQKGAGHLFVVVATNTVVRGVLALGDAMHWKVPVIDIQETSQRNLQSELAGREGRTDRATAALVLVSGHQALLTICANGELFYTRRFELPDGFLTSVWGEHKVVAAAPPDSAASFASEVEYVPDYSTGDAAYGRDYADTADAPSESVDGSAAGSDKTQRFVVEVQRSLDVWSRTWSSMPLYGVRVYAGDRSEELAQWLGMQLGQAVQSMNVNALFPGFEGGSAADQSECLPLLGVLMRTENRKL